MSRWRFLVVKDGWCGYDIECLLRTYGIAIKNRGVVQQGDSSQIAGSSIITHTIPVHRIIAIKRQIPIFKAVSLGCIVLPNVIQCSGMIAADLHVGISGEERFNCRAAFSGLRIGEKLPMEISTSVS